MRGSYILVIKCTKNCKVKVGSLGNIYFRKGFYFYIGSALNNIEKRIHRHLKKRKKIFWHIDYLTTNKNFKILKAIYKKSKNREECKISKILMKKFKFIKKFGCSDCKCKSHLFYGGAGI
ncbi:MAG: GIY-YIG nuclease family protein [Candidatus Aenigmarchaeota archaeon]|nr:GIY-YIG nuclease family protein [Candidatus Aenigmarchaeota archaeon]MDW8149660.1 GIY-YIG nuclease family protein [Candidatus Aenigmarchaeota archaeon]